MRAVGFRRCRHGTAIAAADAGMPQYLAEDGAHHALLRYALGMDEGALCGSSGFMTAPDLQDPVPL
jgi:hypothetical protein